MARGIDERMTFDELDGEIIFTRAALKADEDASDLVVHTDGWLGQVDVVRQQDREVQAEVVEADAERTVANLRLDRTCEEFGNDLLGDCHRDRKSTRWLAYFKVAPSQFIRQPLPDQINAVLGWLPSSGDPVLERHRAELTRWVNAANTALIKTRSLAVRRGENWIRREQLADDLTRARDALYILLVQRAQERHLPRDWPATFFRSTRTARPTRGSVEPA